MTKVRRYNAVLEAASASSGIAFCSAIVTTISLVATLRNAAEQPVNPMFQKQ
jgi:hypothetical protein